jgi:hypothetical protein
VSYEAISRGLQTRLATVEQIAAVLDYEPSAIQDAPLIYSLLDGFECRSETNTSRITWRTQHRLLIRWQDAEACEAELRSLVGLIRQAVAADRTLGGTAADAEMVFGDAGWLNVGGTEYRSMDFSSEVIEYEATGE